MHTRTLLDWLAAAIFALGLVHLGFLAWSGWSLADAESDAFRLAGDLWAAGENPYGPRFAEEAAAQGVAETAWRKPPGWFVFASASSLPGAGAGEALWKALTAVLLLAATFLNIVALRNMTGRTRLIHTNAPVATLLRKTPVSRLFAFHAGLAMTALAAPSLALGQSSVLVYFGASLLAAAATQKRTAVGAVGLALLLLDPAIGLALAAALAFTAYGRRVIAAGGLLSFLLAAPALAITPAPDILASLFSGAGDADGATGLAAVASALGGADMGALFYQLLALIAVCAIGLMGGKRTPAPRTIDMMMIALAAIMLFAPLQIGDHAFVGAVVLYTACLPRPANVIAAAGVILIWRPGSALYAAFSSADAASQTLHASLYTSLGAAILLAAMLWAFLTRGVPVSRRGASTPYAFARGR